MKPPRPFLIVLAIDALSIAHATAQPKSRSREMTLADARAALVGKKVVIVGKTSQDYPLKGYLHNWSIAVGSGGEYRENRESIMNYISESYQGKEAEVVALQLNSLEKERSGAGGVNALGEKTTDETLV